MNLNSIIFQTLRSTPDGVGATTGKQTEEAFNNNFELVKNLLTDLFSIASITVTAQDIKQLKYDTNTHEVYFSLDDESVAEPTWISMSRPQFSNIQGDPLTNIALKEILDSKATTSALQALSSIVSADSGTLETAVTDITALKTTTNTLSGDITSIRADLQDVVRTDGANQLYIRYVPATNSIEYSTDKAHWKDINDANVAFSHISGNASDNQSLVTYVAQQIAASGGDYVAKSTFNAHTQNRNNPHQVTKAQIGLGNVENYSAADMPISNAVQAALDNLNVDTAITTLNPSEYYDSQFTPIDKAYFISSSFLSPPQGGGN